jgi:ABC-2 type transport system permease protein
VRPRLLLHVVSVEARKLMSYRADFWITSVVGLLVELAVAVFLWRAIFAGSGAAEIGGFTLRGMVVYYLLALTCGKLTRGRQESVTLGTDVYEGHLTRYLLYPAPYMGFKYGEQLGALVPAVVQLVLLVGGLLLVFDLPPEITITPASVAMAGLAILGGNLLVLLLLYPVQGLAFWADNVWSLNVLVRIVGEVFGGMLLPLAVFPLWAQPVLELLPFRFLYSFPVLTAIGRIGVGEWLVGMALLALWCAVLAGLGRAVWRRGLLSYTGVGI